MSYSAPYRFPMQNHLVSSSSPIHDILTYQSLQAAILSGRGLLSIGVPEVPPFCVHGQAFSRAAQGRPKSTSTSRSYPGSRRSTSRPPDSSSRPYYSLPSDSTHRTAHSQDSHSPSSSARTVPSPPVLRHRRSCLKHFLSPSASLLFTSSLREFLCPLSDLHLDHTRAILFRYPDYTCVKFM